MMAVMVSSRTGNGRWLIVVRERKGAGMADLAGIG